MDRPVKLTPGQRDVMIWEIHTKVNKIDEKLGTFATKRELNIHRGLIFGLFSALFTLGCKIVGVFK